jgi:hypothetical protein
MNSKKAIKYGNKLNLIVDLQYSFPFLNYTPNRPSILLLLTDKGSQFLILKDYYFTAFNTKIA